MYSRLNVLTNEINTLGVKDITNLNINCKILQSLQMPDYDFEKAIIYESCPSSRRCRRKSPKNHLLQPQTMLFQANKRRRWVGCLPREAQVKMIVMMVTMKTPQVMKKLSPWWTCTWRRSSSMSRKSTCMATMLTWEKGVNIHISRSPRSSTSPRRRWSRRGS
jgi:hypothetical protein